MLPPASSGWDDPSSGMYVGPVFVSLEICMAEMVLYVVSLLLVYTY